MNIRKKREEYGFKRREMAEYLGLTEPFIRCIENGSRGTNIENYSKIAKMLGVTLDEITNVNNLQKVSEPHSKKTNYKKKLESVCQAITEEQAEFLLLFTQNLVDYTQKIQENNKLKTTE